MQAFIVSVQGLDAQNRILTAHGAGRTSKRMTNEAGRNIRAIGSRESARMLSVPESRAYLERWSGLAIARGTFYYWLRRRLLFSIRLGNRFLIPEGALVEFAETRWPKSETQRTIGET